MARGTLLTNATIISLDPATPVASAVGMRGDRIAWVEDVRDARDDFSGPYDTVDLGGATVTPGLIDAHHHLMTLGFWMSQIDCYFPAVRSVQDIVRAVGQRSAEVAPGEWILGRGYDDNKLTERRHITRWDLDTVSPHHPVMIRNVSGHMSVVNTAALALAGITRDTVSPFGGHIARNDAGEPTGLLQEQAQELLNMPFLRLRPGTPAALRAAFARPTPFSSPVFRVRSGSVEWLNS